MPVALSRRSRVSRDDIFRLTLHRRFSCHPFAEPLTGHQNAASLLRCRDGPPLGRAGANSEVVARRESFDRRHSSRSRCLERAGWSRGGKAHRVQLPFGRGRLRPVSGRRRAYQDARRRAGRRCDRPGLFLGMREHGRHHCRAQHTADFVQLLVRCTVRQIPVSDGALPVSADPVQWRLRSHPCVLCVLGSLCAPRRATRAGRPRSSALQRGRNGRSWPPC